jgi:hypothetical protein
VDPLKKEYPELTPYQFASNTPIQAIDLDGLEAYAVFNKSTNTLVLVPDVSKLNAQLMTKFVSAFEYAKLTPEMQKEANYGIVVKNVFTGGNVKDGVIVYGTIPEEIPISTGTYNILENKGNENPTHVSFFVLDPQDDSPFDKTDDRPGETNSKGEKRTGYNLHPGRRSFGCVTICKDDPNLTVEQRDEEWNIVNDAIENTKKELVPDNRGRHKFLPGKQAKFGILVVTENKPK